MVRKKSNPPPAKPFGPVVPDSPLHRLIELIARHVVEELRRNPVTKDPLPKKNVGPEECE
jgi:hypothetical protein